MNIKILGAGILTVLLALILIYAVSTRERALTREEALTTLIAHDPTLARYQETSLPPSEIVARTTNGGWNVAFVVRGSGLPGVMNAECYFVNEDREVQSTGTYARTESEVADDVRIENCAPILAPQEVPVTPTPISEPPVSAAKECYVGGCSGQLCSDEPGMASTCEYRSEYACYRTTTCERQANGACGWTRTPALDACLAKSAAEE